VSLFLQCFVFFHPVETCATYPQRFIFRTVVEGTGSSVTRLLRWCWWYWFTDVMISWWTVSADQVLVMSSVIVESRRRSSTLASEPTCPARLDARSLSVVAVRLSCCRSQDVHEWTTRKASVRSAQYSTTTWRRSVHTSQP